MIKSILVLVSLTVTCLSHAFDQKGVSAVRPLNQNWKISAAQFEFRRQFDFNLFSYQGSDKISAYDQRAAKIDLSQLPEFGKGDAEYYQLFNEIRDKRFLPDPQVKNFPRRISWLYPYDGCFSRAEHVAKLITKADEKARFGRVFIFGNLEVKTPNSTTGSVGWWYHVAVIFKSQGVAYVIDPSLNYYKPLELAAWVKLMVPRVEDAELALCSAWTYVPNSNCGEKVPMSEASAVSAISSYLRAERQNLIELGRDPEVELGSSPPWL